jgi:hypothetical protein
MPHNEIVQKFLDILGPFYEYVDENNETMCNNLSDNHLIINGFNNNSNSSINKDLNDLSGL